VFKPNAGRENKTPGRLPLVLNVDAKVVDRYGLGQAGGKLYRVYRSYICSFEI